jgi:hypothetical protein
MKRIPLRSLADPHDATSVIDYRAVIEQCLRVPLDRQTGATIDEMRKSIRILDALEVASDTLALEDADWEFLKRKVDAMPWAVVDRRIVRFHDDIVGASDESINGLVRAEEVTA